MKKNKKHFLAIVAATVFTMTLSTTAFAASTSSTNAGAYGTLRGTINSGGYLTASVSSFITFVLFSLESFLKKKKFFATNFVCPK